MKNYIICCFLCLALQWGVSQDKYIFNQYVITPSLVNPGAVGFNGTHDVMMNYKSSWASFPGAPKTFTLHYNGPIANRFGFGAQLLNDNFASLNTIRGLLNFSYTIDAESYKVGAGLSTEYVQYRLRNLDLQSDQVDLTDMFLQERLNDRSFFEASLGVHAVLNDKLTIDFALPSLVSSLINGKQTSRDSSANFQYLFGLGYEFGIKDYDMKVKPSIFVNRFRYIPLHVDLNLVMEFLDGKLLSGVNYTLGADNGLGFLIGTKVNNIVFNYSYNVSLNPIQVYNNGGHELSLGLRLAN